MQKNKGAMFGLDARIALAIFGSLSVISGAALYSAIQNSQVVSRVTFLQEVAKAIEAYILDVKTVLPDHPAGTFFDAKKLISSSDPNWGGPYLPLEIGDRWGYTEIALETPNYDNSVASGVVIRRYKTGSTSGLVACTSGTDCTVWISLLEQDRELAKQLDIYVDGSSDRNLGDIRMSATTNYDNIWFDTGISIEHL